MNFTKATKFKTVVWRNNDVLKGIQLKFEDGIETPMFQKDALRVREQAGRAIGKWATKSAEIDTSKRVSKVSIKVRKDQFFMDALRMEDDEGNVLIDLVWCESKESEWQTRLIPLDKEIIGLYMSKKGSAEAIQNLGFILWEPHTV